MRGRGIGAVSVLAPDRHERNGTLPDAPRLSRHGRRMHLPTVLVGVLLVAGCALAFGLVADGLSERTPVVVLAGPVARGAVLSGADLAVAQIAADPGVRVTPAADRDRLVGRPLLAALPAGALVTADVLGPAGVEAGPGTATVGLALEPGAYPTADLAPGDRVAVLSTDDAGGVLAPDATVVAAAPVVDGAATLLVSVVVTVEQAPAVSAAAARDGARLALVAP